MNTLPCCDTPIHRVWEPRATQVPNLYNEAIKCAVDYRNWDMNANPFVPRDIGSYTHFRPHQRKVEVAPRPPRYWMADLNDLVMRRSMMQQEEPREYEHHNRRQAYLQLLATDWPPNRRDPYTKFLADPANTYGALVDKFGREPCFTKF